MVGKLVHLRHFMEPLSVLAVDELIGEPDLDAAAKKLERPASRPFLNSLLARLHHPVKSNASQLAATNGTSMDVDKDPPNGHSPTKNLSPSKQSRKGKERADAVPSAKPHAKWRPGSGTASGVLELVRETREYHWRRTTGTRVSFRIFLLIREFIVQNGHKNLLDAGYRGVNGARKAERTVCEMMVACLRGTLVARDGRAVANAIKLVFNPFSSSNFKFSISFIGNYLLSIYRH